MLSDSKLQPYVHDCVLEVLNDGWVHRFWVFFKRHCYMRLNKCVKGSGLRGDVLVVRLSNRGGRHSINMRTGDSSLSDYAIQRYCVILTAGYNGGYIAKRESLV
jgi:hypothetical protein